MGSPVEKGKGKKANVPRQQLKAKMLQQGKQ